MILGRCRKRLVMARPINAKGMRARISCAFHTSRWVAINRKMECAATTVLVWALEAARCHATIRRWYALGSKYPTAAST